MAMTLDNYGYNLRVTTNAASRIQDNCISCHGEVVSQMLENSKQYTVVDSKVQMGRKCWDCHREVPHGTTRNLTTAEHNLGVKEL
jgi:cytochrome c nitrite reductase small subunit